MARVKLTEFRAKSILIPDYQGVEIHEGSATQDVEQLQNKTQYVIKVDQGVKKRGKLGLLKLNVLKKDMAKAVQELLAKGFTNFLAEPMLPHESNEEHYLSLERTRDGMLVSYSPHGGVDIEDNAESVQRTLLEDISTLPVPADLLQHLANTMNQQHWSFVEINPFILQGEETYLLDAAVLADDAGTYFAKDWTEADVVDSSSTTPEEQAVTELDANSPAALKLKVLNPQGSIWTLFSGGGASITIADEIQAAGLGTELGNYGEYSGGPSTEETYLYTQSVLQLLLKSTAAKKVLIIAGGVANFTDVKKTFAGIIAALKEVAPQLAVADVKVFVRRGGPNEAEGLAHLESFLRDQNLLGSVHGSSDLLTIATTNALTWLEKQDA